MTDWLCSCKTYNDMWKIACQACGKKRPMGTRSDKLMRLESELPPEIRQWLYDAPMGDEHVRMVPLTAYLDLMDKFKTVNFEYTKLSNTWMGFAAQKHPSNLDVSIMELRGEFSVKIADRILKRMEEVERNPGWRKWKFRLATWLWSKLTNSVWVYGMRRY